MKIKIEDIPDGGIQIDADSASNDWFSTLLTEVLGPEKIKTGDFCRLNLQVVKSDKDVTIAGGAILKFHPTCDRCLDVFEKQQQIPFHMMLSPVAENKTKKEDVNVDDDGFGFYKGDVIDISELVREQVILAQEIVNICKDSCKGLCQTCGKNRNKGECRCDDRNSEQSPFAVLKKLQKT